MTTFALDTDNAITAFATPEEAISRRAGSTEGTFASEKELAKLTSGWPLSRLAEIWNAFASVVPFDSPKPVKKFTDRQTAANRIWKAIQALTPAPAQHAAPSAPKKARAIRDVKPKDAATGSKGAREGSKKAAVLDMLKRPAGATLAEIMSATGWQAHSIRGFISASLSQKMGIKVESTKNQTGARTYRITS